MKNIKQKIGTGIVLFTTGLANLINGGCEMTPAQNMAISGTSAQHIATTNPNLSYQQGQSLGVIGGLLGVLSQQEAMKEAAEAGKSENVVNVNIPQQQNYQPQANIISNEEIKSNTSFVCRDYKDLDGDGYINPTNELIGVGNYFKCDNEYTENNPLRINIGAIWRNVRGQSILTKIKEIDNGKITCSENAIPYSDVINWNLLKFWKSKQDQGIDEFSVEFYKNGQLDPSKTISFFIDYGNKLEDSNMVK